MSPRVSVTIHKSRIFELMLPTTGTSDTGFGPGWVCEIQVLLGHLHIAITFKILSQVIIKSFVCLWLSTGLIFWNWDQNRDLRSRLLVPVAFSEIHGIWHFNSENSALVDGL